MCVCLCVRLLTPVCHSMSAMNELLRETVKRKRTELALVHMMPALVKPSVTASAKLLSSGDHANASSTANASATTEIASSTSSSSPSPLTLLAAPVKGLQSLLTLVPQTFVG